MKRMSMKRILVFVVVLALALAMAAPAFAVKGGNGGGATVSETDDCRVGGGVQTTGQLVVTPSGNHNLQCHFKAS
jgi:hypothetical protein